MSTTEAILDAVYSALEAQGLPLERNAASPVEVGPDGLVIFRDGDPGEPERLLGGFEESYYTHVPEIELYVQKLDGENRDTVFENLVSGVKAALFADKTFGGLIYGFTVSRPEVFTAADEGVKLMKVGIIRPALEYQLSNPLD